jgi:outer membrane protein assembly factor BamE (lipoprotein component of BamABCDE complex)
MKNPVNILGYLMRVNSLLLILASFVISSCQYQFFSGTNITNDQLSSLQNSNLSKIEIEQKFGTPTLIPDYSQDTWYYIYRHSTKRAFFDPKIKEQKVVVIKFNNEKLDSVELLENQHNQDIKIVSEYIRTQGSEKNPLQEYVGNIGRFHKHNKKESRR